MKVINHTEIKRRVSEYDLEGPIKDIFPKLEAVANGLKNPRLVIEAGHDYFDLYVMGWKPMSLEEIEKAEAKAKKRRDREQAAKTLKQERRKARLIKEAEKFGFELKEKS